MPLLTDDERVGTSIAGKYRLESILGKGGMGVVFRGVHTWTGRAVAVKLLHPTYAQDTEVVRRFLHEARAASSIHHPNVVEVLDMGNDADGTVYLVLELLRGQPLADLLEGGERLEPQQMLRHLGPILRALCLAHTRGIVHRDLKPDNIFLAINVEGLAVPKLLDFGIAKLTEGVHGHTRTGAVMGTPYYMSPEQASGASDVGPAADVWSMGVVAYQCLSGALPFTGSSATAILVSVITTKAPSLALARPDLPPAIIRAVDRALEADRSVRYATMDAFHAALTSAIEGPLPIELASTAPSHPHAPPQPTPDTRLRVSQPVPTPFATSGVSTMPTPPRPSRAPLFAGLGVLALVAVAGGGLVLFGGGAASAPPPASAMPFAAPPPSASAIAVTPPVDPTSAPEDVAPSAIGIAVSANPDAGVLHHRGHAAHVAVSTAPSVVPPTSVARTTSLGAGASGPTPRGPSTTEAAGDGSHSTRPRPDPDSEHRPAQVVEW